MKQDLIIISILTGFLLIVLFEFSSPKTSEPLIENMENELFLSEKIIAPNLIYGFNTDSFFIEKSRIKPNEYLSNLLTKYGIDYATIDELVRRESQVLDVRKIRTGQAYAFIQALDTTNRDRFFVYEENPTDYLLFHFRDSSYIERKFKPKEVSLQYASGEIQSSLWNSMIDGGVNPMLAIELSEIYAWSIDFFGIQKGDYFRVFYTEAYVDSISIGIQSIQAACFTHKQNDFWAIGFVQDSVYAFFDTEGQSLRKAFLKAPLRYSRISSGFSHNRKHPVLKIYRPHHGIDYAAPTGTPVYTIGDGIVAEKAYQNKGGGNYVKIKHNSVYTSVYMHLHGFAKGLKKGQFLKQGELIGYVGSTGLSTGPHLDFRIYQNGQAINPLHVKSPPVDPIKENNSIPFEGFAKHWQAKFKMAENYPSGIIRLE